MKREIEMYGLAKIAQAYYHLSQQDLHGQTLTPRVPKNYLVNHGYEDTETARVSLAPSVDLALRAMAKPLHGQKYYVHEVDGNATIRPATQQEVPDSVVTHEAWGLSPIKLRRTGQIEIGKAKPNGIPYSYGNNQTAELYDWDWKYVK